MAPFKGMQKRFHNWTWRIALKCCCVVERLDSWESMQSEDWKEKFLSPWASSEHGQEYGHLVSVEMMRSWGSRGDFLRALKDESFLAPGSMLNLHPVLPVCLGFRNCELTAGKDYSCYCRVRTILRGAKPSELDIERVKLDCEPVVGGMSAAYWVQCINPMLPDLYQLSSLRHKRSNFSDKKLMTNDAIMSDPIHMMYVHIEGMIPQFGPFLFEAWRRNQGLQMGPAGEALQHGIGMVITHPRRQALEAQLRQIFPNKPLRMKTPPANRCCSRRKSSIIGMSSSCIFATTIVGELSDTLGKIKPNYNIISVIDTGSAVNINQSAECQSMAEEEKSDEVHGGTQTVPLKVDKILPPVVIEPIMCDYVGTLKKRPFKRVFRTLFRNIFRGLKKRIKLKNS